MATSVGAATTAASSSLDQLGAQYQALLQSTTVVPLQTQQSTLNSYISSISTLKTDLNALYTSAQSLAAIGSSSPMSAFSVDSSDSTVVDATATSNAFVGSHTIDSVTRLAKSDTLLSGQFAAGDTSMITALGAGAKTFSINGVQVTATLTDGETNGQVLSDIATAINNTTGITVTASVLNIDGNNSELALTSRSTGFANRISSVTDGNSTVAALLGYGGVTFADTVGGASRTLASTTQAGFQQGFAENLDASFSLDGVAMTRGTNTITDAVPGLTIKLKNTSATSQTLTIAADSTSIESTINDFITKYNAVITYLANNTGVTSSGTRGTFADDSNVNVLATDLRSTMLQPVTSVAAGAPALLSAVGITTNDDGTLSLSDTSELESALAANPKQVSDLFNSTNGLAGALVAKLKPYVTYGGTLDTETKNTNAQIKDITDRINTLNARIDVQVAAYKQQFEQIQILLDQATQTQQEVASFSSYASAG
ncbi:MAG TPA: flagellar filament capping protein FliD [Bacteroidota bacterium]|nr:flagellar filament capping protein FliD [Bacteroidota bacterium]